MLQPLCACANGGGRYTANGRRCSMASPDPDSPRGDVPAAFYQMIREQTQPAGRGNSAGLLACAVFVIVGALLVLALELGADIEQVLIAVFAIAVVNLVLALIW